MIHLLTSFKKGALRLSPLLGFLPSFPYPRLVMSLELFYRLNGDDAIYFSVDHFLTLLTIFSM